MLTAASISRTPSRVAWIAVCSREPNRISRPVNKGPIVQRGYSEQDIRQILGLNMLRITRDVLSAGQQTRAK